MKRLALLALLSSSGCALLLGLEDLPNGSPDADIPDAMIDATPPPPAVLSIDVERYDMGAALVGATSIPAHVTITNVGTTRTGALTPTIAAPFAAAGSCVNAELDPGATCLVELTVTPSAAANLSERLTVTAFGGGGVETTIVAEVLQPGTLAASPDSVDFGLLGLDLVGASRFISITNPPAAVLSGNMTVRVTGQDATSFALSRNECGGFSIAAVGLCAVELRAVARKTGRARAIVAITSPNAGAIVFPVVATGYATGSMMITGTTPFAFAPTTVGAMSAPATFMIMNTGTVDTGPITAEWSSGHFAVTSNGCAAGLLPSTTCSIEVRGTPMAAGIHSGTLRLQGATTGGWMLSGTVTGNAPAELDVSATSFTFPLTAQDPGAAPLNSSATGFVRAFNKGNVAFGAALTTNIVPAGEFTATAPGACNALAARSLCLIQLGFKPTGTGLRTATLTITAPGGQSKTVQLSGMGSADPGLRFGAGNGVFTETNVGSESTLTVTLFNRTGADVTGLTFNATAPFSLDAETCADPLPDAGNCTVTWAFNPTSPGLFSALITVGSTQGNTALYPVVGMGRATVNIPIQGLIAFWPPPESGGATCSSPCSRVFTFPTFEVSHLFDASTMPPQTFGTGICDGYGRTPCSTTFPHTGLTANQPGPGSVTATVAGPTFGRLEGPTSGILCPPHCSSTFRSGQPVRVSAVSLGGMVSVYTCAGGTLQGNVCDGTAPNVTFVDGWVDRHAGLDGGTDEVNAVFVRADNVIFATGSETDTANGADLLLLQYAAAGTKTQDRTANYLADDRGQDLTIRTDMTIATAVEQGVGTPSAGPVLVSWTNAVPSNPTTINSGATASFGLARLVSTTQNSLFAIAPTSAGTDTVIRRWDTANANTTSLDPRRWRAIAPHRGTDHALVAGTFNGDLVIGKLNNGAAFDWAQTRARAGEDVAVDLVTFPNNNNLLIVTNETVDGRGTNVRLVEWAADGSAEVATTTFDSGPESPDLAIAAAVDANGQIHVLGTTGSTIWVRRWSRQLEPTRARFLSGTNLVVRDLGLDSLGNVIVVGSEEVGGQRDAMVRKTGP
jgi:hypothetical protein